MADFCWVQTHERVRVVWAEAIPLLTLVSTFMAAARTMWKRKEEGLVAETVIRLLQRIVTPSLQRSPVFIRTDRIDLVMRRLSFSAELPIKQRLFCNFGYPLIACLNRPGFAGDSLVQIRLR